MSSDHPHRLRRIVLAGVLAVAATPAILLVTSAIPGVEVVEGVPVRGLVGGLVFASAAVAVRIAGCCWILLSLMAAEPMLGLVVIRLPDLVDVGLVVLVAAAMGGRLGLHLARTAGGAANPPAFARLMLITTAVVLWLPVLALG